jgi:hypothetical protein
MHERAMRAMSADWLNPSDTAGNTMNRSAAHGSVNTDAYPPAGSQPSFTAKR